MGTINGAKALGLGDVTGSLTPGKRADIVLIRTNDVNTAPLGNIEATVVMSATAAECRYGSCRRALCEERRQAGRIRRRRHRCKS